MPGAHPPEETLAALLWQPKFEQAVEILSAEHPQQVLELEVVRLNTSQSHGNLLWAGDF